MEHSFSPLGRTVDPKSVSTSISRTFPARLRRRARRFNKRWLLGFGVERKSLQGGVHATGGRAKIMDFLWGRRIGHLLEKFPQRSHGFFFSIEVQCHGCARILGLDDRLGNIVRQKVQNFWEGMGLCPIEKPDRVRTGLLAARVFIFLIVIYRRCWDCPWLTPDTPCVASYASLHRLRCRLHYQS